MEGLAARMPQEPEKNEERLQELYAETGATVIEEGRSGLSSHVYEARFSMLPPNTLEAMQLLADVTAEYLRRPIVTDAFSDHFERTAWRNKVKGEFGGDATSLFEDNRLKGNKMLSIFNRASVLRRLLPEGPALPYIEQTRETLDHMLALAGPFQIFSLNYNAKDNFEKVDFVRTLSELSAKYLELVTMPQEGRAREAA